MVVILLIYLCLFSFSALFVGTISGIKEVIQSVLMLSFVFVAFGYYRTRSADRLLLLASVLILGVLAYNIAWHVSQGQYVSWKRLNEPKTTFTLLPLLVILLSNRFGIDRSRLLFYVAFSAAAVVIFLSGERKAYIVAMAAFAIWTSPINWRHLIALTVAIPLIWAGASADGTGYLSRQISSLTSAAPSDVGAPSTAFLLDERRPTTWSTAQREFTNRLAMSMWEKHPVLGIGTNRFAAAINQDSSIPEVFRLGIHGEFYRALFENGILGLALYVALWVGAYVRIMLAWASTKAAARNDLNKIKLLCVTMFGIYCATEASKGLTLLCICLLPFLVSLPTHAFQRTMMRSIVQPRGVWT